LAVGFYNAARGFWLGWEQEVVGDHAAAQESWRQARSELQSFLEEQPENFQLIGDLALSNAGLGDKATALALAERAVALVPIDKDAWQGPAAIEFLARVAAGGGGGRRPHPRVRKTLSNTSGDTAAR